MEQAGIRVLCMNDHLLLRRGIATHVLIDGEVA
jgi:hypothetical protein